MKVLIVFASNEGQTRKIVEFIGDKLSKDGHEIVSHNVDDLARGLVLSDFDKVIVAGSVHSGAHQEALDIFVFANRDQLTEISSLLVSVSLAIVFPENLGNAVRYVEDFKKSTKWTPGECALVAGAMRHGAYSWYEESKLLEGDLEEHANKELKDDHEYTDWNALEKTVGEFIRH